MLPATWHLITDDYWTHRAGDSTADHPVLAHLDTTLDTSVTPTPAGCTLAIDVLVRTAEYLSAALPHADLHGPDLVTPVHGLNLLCAHLAHITGHLSHHVAGDWTGLPPGNRGEAVGQILAAVHDLQDSAKQFMRLHHCMTNGTEAPR